QTGGTEILHHAGPRDRGIHLCEAIEHLQALLPFLDVGQEPILLQWAGDTRHGNTWRDQGPEQALSEAHGSDHVLLSGVVFARALAQPALGPHLLRLARVPDIHGAEVRAWRVRVAHAVDDGQLALIPEPLHRSHRRMEAVGLVELQDLIVGGPDRWTVVAVQRVIEGNDRVEIVVAARE